MKERRGDVFQLNFIFPLIPRNCSVREWTFSFAFLSLVESNGSAMIARVASSANTNSTQVRRRGKKEEEEQEEGGGARTRTRTRIRTRTRKREKDAESETGILNPLFFSPLFTDSKKRVTKAVYRSMNPELNYTKQFTIKSVSDNFLKYLSDNALVIEVSACVGFF